MTTASAPARQAPAVHTRPDQPLRVLDITDFYSDTASGGVKTYLHRKMKYLAEAGISHAVVVPGAASTMKHEGETRFYRVRGPSIVVSKGYRTFSSAKDVDTVLRKEQPDVVEVGSPFVAPWLLRKSHVTPAPATVGFYHADLVRTFAEPYVPHRWAAPIRVALRMTARRYARDVYRMFDATVAASPSVAQELEGFGVPRVHHVSLGVDLELFRLRGPQDMDLRRRYGLPADRPVAVFVGRFAAEKRLDVILDGHALLPEDDRPHVVLVGDGPQRAQLEQRAAGQAHFSILPYQSSREELAKLYGSCDMYLASGPGETFGLSIAEALASGLPVVSVNRGASPDRVAGCDAAELYAHGDPAGAARALARMTHRLHPSLRIAARVHAEREFDWDRTFARMVELYRALAAKRRR